jgi:predicted TIM-barrel fold metal-dependent hydrolase
MIVDTHPHIIAADTLKYPIAPVGGVQSEWSKGFSFSADEFIVAMDAAGVAAATLVQASTVHGNDNSFVADSVARHPDRFVGVGGLDPLANDAREQLAYWIGERGLSGMRVFAGGSTVTQGSPWLSDTALDPLWSAAAADGIPIHLQVRFGDIDRLASIAERHPGLTIVVDNLGVPPVEDGPPYAGAKKLFDMARFPRVNLKFTQLNLDRAAAGGGSPHDLLAALVSHYGAGRIMWGSNFPNARPVGDAPYTALVEAAREAVSGFTPAEQAEMLGGTAVRNYPALRPRG